MPRTENNKSMVDLLRAAAAADAAALRAFNASLEAKKYANAVNEFYSSIRAELKMIEAKKTLRIRLTARECAVWTLYGEEC